MKIICINGMPTVGKDTFVELCSENKNVLVSNYSTVDFVKEVAKFCGWNGIKDAKSRKFLSDIKDALTTWNDVPLNKIKEKILQNERILRKERIEDFPTIYFIHTREPQELKRLKKEWGAKTLLIRRDAVETENQSNHADALVHEFDYDYTIFNNGTIEDLKKIANDFIIYLLDNEDWDSEFKEDYNAEAH